MTSEGSLALPPYHPAGWQASTIAWPPSSPLGPGRRSGWDRDRRGRLGRDPISCRGEREGGKGESGGEYTTTTRGTVSRFGGQTSPHINSSLCRKSSSFNCASFPLFSCAGGMSGRAGLSCQPLPPPLASSKIGRRIMWPLVDVSLPFPVRPPNPQ